MQVRKEIPNKMLLAFSAILIFLGIFYRFYIQFFSWSYNGDEVNLGLGILNRSWESLFTPLENMQTAPPLFLFLQKAISLIAKPFISLKILSFVTSCVSLFFFARLLKYFSPFLQILLLAMFCFSPFIISNSLTLKQYSFDLMLGLVAVNYFVEPRRSYKTFLFFSFFCLLSNIGLFFCAAIAIFCFSQFYFERNNFDLWKRFERIFPFLLAPIPYLVFFLWFMQQPGAENMRNYMVGYWSDAFMPLDISFFRWVAIQGKVIMIFFLSTYWMIGIPLLILLLLGIFFIFKNRQLISRNRILRIICIYILTALVHLLLSALKLYPFSDRLFLYLAPGVYLILGYGIQESLKMFRKKNYSKIPFYSTISLLICTIILYLNYLPGKANDVVALIRFVNSTEDTVLLTPKARDRTQKWLKFTEYEEEDPAKLSCSEKLDTANISSRDLLIAVQSEKFGHKKKLSSLEPLIEQLLGQDKIHLFHRVGGYTIYKIK